MLHFSLCPVLNPYFFLIPLYILNINKRRKKTKYQPCQMCALWETKWLCIETGKVINQQFYHFNTILFFFYWLKDKNPLTWWYTHPFCCVYNRHIYFTLSDQQATHKWLSKYYSYFYIR